MTSAIESQFQPALSSPRQFQLGNMESIRLNDSEKVFYDSSGHGAQCDASSDTSIMYPNQTTSQSGSSSYLESCPLAPIPCVVSSILRKKHFSSPVILSRESKMKEVLDTIGIMDTSSRSNEHESYTFDMQDIFHCGFSPSTIVLQGLAGSGKTKLAAMLCHRVDVRKHFAQGGIAWVDLSRYSSNSRKRTQLLSSSKENSLEDKENPTAPGQKIEMRPRRRWTATGFMHAHEEASSKSLRENPIDSDDHNEDSDTNLNALADRNQDNLLSFGDGIRPISDEDLIKCYITICNQLDIPIPKPFHHIFSKMLRSKSEKHQATKPYSHCLQDGNDLKEQYRQIMANHLHRTKLRMSSKAGKENSERRRKRVLVVLDNLSHPDDIEWFEFNMVETNIYILVTTRLASDFGKSQYVELKLGVLSDSEASALVMCNTICEEKDNHSSQKLLIDEFQNSFSANGLSQQIASLCGNLPSAITSVNRWIHSIISTQTKNPRMAMEEVVGILESSNIFEHDPELIEELDLFKIVDRSLDSKSLGESTSRILKLCIASFAVVFTKKNKKNKKKSKGNQSESIPLSIPIEYVKILWDNLLASEIVSHEERELVKGKQTRLQKHKDEFSKIRHALTTLGIMDEVDLDTSDRRKVICLKFSHIIYQIYGEFLLRDSEDHLQIQQHFPSSDIEETWNNALATECDKNSGRWDSWEILQGTVDDHLFEMLPTYMIRGNMIDVALSLLNDKPFIRGRLAAIGIVNGTKCHIKDCELIFSYMKKDDKNNAKSSLLNAYSKLATSLSEKNAYIISSDKESKLIDKEVALAMHDLVYSLHQKKFYENAIKFVENCLKCKKDAYEEDHEEIANTISLKARILEKKGTKDIKFIDQALEDHQEALRIRRKSCPSMHLDTATTLIAIGNIYLNKENYLKAINALEEALHIRKHIAGDDNEESASALCSLGLAYQEVEAYNKALVCYERALEIKQTILGENCKACADIISQIAKLHKEAKQNNLALQRFKEALRLFRILGMKRDDPDVVEATLFVNWVTSSNTSRKQSLQL